VAEFLKPTQDTFPYIESTLRILDDNLNWWKAHHDEFDEHLLAVVSEVNPNATIEAKFIIYNGPDERVNDVKRHQPAIKFTIENVTPEETQEIGDKLGKEWKGHVIFTHDEDIIVLIE
jgi:hypothetical protein